MSATPIPAKGANAASRSTQSIRSKADLLAALDFTLPRGAASQGYGVGMGLLAVGLACIPAAFLAVLAFMAYLVLWHAYQGVVTLSEGPYFIFHLPMALLGGLLLVFLLKPIFFRRRAKDEGVFTLREADEPLLFAYVRKLCESAGAPPPAAIEIDCEPNAGARFRGGARSLVRRELVLRIGLSLAAELPLRQFTGVLAHELGHFNQRHGMLGSYLIRRLAHLFVQIVFQRDRLDLKLLMMRRSKKPVRRLLYWAAVGPIEAARGVLWLMLVAAELLSCGVLRRMEYDADRAEAMVAGTREFVRTARVIAFLQIAAAQARYDMADAWENGRLADDLPRLIVVNGRELAKARPQILKQIEAQETGWLDTHPSHSDRIRCVEQLGAPGMFRGHAPSSALFADFSALCKRATSAFYRGALGPKAAEGTLVLTSIIAAERGGERAAFRALHRYLRGHLLPTVPVLPRPEEHFLAAAAAEDATTRIGSARDAVLQAAGSVGRATSEFENDAIAIHVARAQLALCGVFGQSPNVATLRRRAEQDLRRLEAKHAEAMHAYSQFGDLACRRMGAALSMLQSDPFVQRFAAELGNVAARRNRVEQLAAAGLVLGDLLPSMRRLAERSIRVRVLASAHNPSRMYQPLVSQLLKANRDVLAILRETREQLADIPQPFTSQIKAASLGAALVARLPNPQDPADAFGCATAALDAFYGMASHVSAELAQIAEEVERAAGLDPLPEPEEQMAERRTEREAETRTRSRRYWLAYGGRAAAGAAMMAALFWLSVFPPVLPATEWGGRAAPGGYQPSAFRVPFAAAPQQPWPQAPVWQPARLPPPSPRYPSDYVPPGRASGWPPGPMRPGPSAPPVQGEPTGPTAPPEQPGNVRPRPGSPAQAPYSPPAGPTPPTHVPQPAPYVPPNPAPYRPAPGGPPGGGGASHGGGGRR